MTQQVLRQLLYMVACSTETVNGYLVEKYDNVKD